MPKIASILFCEDVQNNLDLSANPPVLKPSFIAPISIIKPYTIPGYFSFAVYLSIAEVNASEKNEIQVTIKDPNNNLVFDTGSILIPQKDEAIKSMDFTLNLRNFLFKLPGAYILSVKLNNEFLDERSFDVESVE